MNTYRNSIQYPHFKYWKNVLLHIGNNNMPTLLFDIESEESSLFWEISSFPLSKPLGGNANIQLLQLLNIQSLMLKSKYEPLHLDILGIHLCL